MKKSPGVTLTELMVAVAVVSIAVLGIIGAFQAIAVGVQHSKMRTLAANLAQEKMQILRQSSYYRLLVTSNTAYDTSFTPAIAYDTSYYPPETIMEGGTYFERLTHVQMAAESGGKITPIGAVSDSGMKMVTVTITWRQGSAKKKLQLQSIKSNPKATMMTSTISGTVRNGATNARIEDATITVAENMGWQGVTDNNGEYSIKVYSGNYSLIVSADGYFDAFAPCSVAENQTLSGTDFYLSAMSSGTVTGTAWINDHIVISQVVGSTVNAMGFDQEYVELYNPTTSYFPMFAGMNIQLAPLYYQNKTDAFPQQITLTAAVPDAGIPAKGYFLIANTPIIMACGVIKTADAYYNPSMVADLDVIKTPDSGGVGISASGVSGPPWYDCVGWDRQGVGHAAPLFEGNGIDQTVGFTPGEQYVRLTSTHNAIGFGRCYDTDNNDRDFYDDATMSATRPPRNSADTEPAIAGKPAIGAIISCNDGLSLPRTAEAVGNPPYARVLLTNIATGTWTMAITSGTHTVEYSTITIAAHGDIITVPNAGTIPAWPVAGQPSAMLTDVSDVGYVSGRISNVAGQSITPAIKVRAGNVEAEADSTSGRYIIPLSSGTYSLTANPGNINTQYVSQTLDNVTVEAGQITSGQDMILSKGGSLRAWVTRDRINPLPGVAVVAIDENGAARAQDVSKSDGGILLVNLATGTYTVKPILDSGETSNPESKAATVAAGATVFASTFTISGAFGSISGQVTHGAKPIATGVLIMASTASIVSPPTINAGLAAASAVYTTNSYENGTFVLDVRGSSTTPYNVRSYYPVPNGSSFTILTGSATSVSVNQGQKVTGINFSW